MAAEQEAPAPTRSPPHTYTIGYAMQPDKLDTVIQPSLVALAAERGMRLVAVDPSRPLVDQGPFHLLIHKLYDESWRAQLEAFSAVHPTVPVVDPPAAIRRLLDRGSMLDVVSELNATVRVGSLGAPRQVAIDDAASLTDPDVVGALQFPLIAKPLDVGGSGDASVPFHNVSSLTTVHADTDDDVGDDAEMPPPGFVEEVGRGLRRALGLQLFNFDMIRGRKAGGQYFIIDINYFPGFDKLHGYEIALTDFFDEMIRGAAATPDEADATEASNVL
uniref:Inositol-tetrakisphosphate 1-kinase 1 n=1 Tax=Aegilops tauschii TaxID=37682 RepID=M8CD92_AEGTA